MNNDTNKKLKGLTRILCGLFKDDSKNIRHVISSMVKDNVSESVAVMSVNRTLNTIICTKYNDAVSPSSLDKTRVYLSNISNDDDFIYWYKDIIDHFIPAARQSLSGAPT